MHHPNRLSALYRTCRIGAYSYVQPSTAPEHRTTLQSGGTGGTRTTSGKAHLIKTREMQLRLVVEDITGYVMPTADAAASAFTLVASLD